MFKSQKKITRHTKKQGSVAQSKKWNKVPESDPKEIETLEYLDKDFKMTVSIMLKELKQNMDRQVK